MKQHRIRASASPGRAACLRPGFALLPLLAVSTLPILAVADLPGEARGTVAAVFAPGITEAAVMSAVVEAGGLVVRSGGWGAVLVVHSDEAGFARRL